VEGQRQIGTDWVMGQRQRKTEEKVRKKIGFKHNDPKKGKNCSKKKRKEKKKRG
jgi:hypothetical protein